MNSASFPSIRCFRKSSSSGGLTCRRSLSLKKRPATERKLTTPLFLLRCVQLGISIRDLDLLTVGLVNDMYIESDNDDQTYAQIGTQAEMDAF